MNDMEHAAHTRHGTARMLLSRCARGAWRRGMLQLLSLPCHGAQVLCRWAGSPEQNNWGNPLNRAQAWAELPVLEEPIGTLQAGPQHKANRDMGHSSWHRQTAGGHELGTRVQEETWSCLQQGLWTCYPQGKLSPKLHPQDSNWGELCQAPSVVLKSACDRGCPGRA